MSLYKAMLMSQVKMGKWGKNLAIRIPAEIAEASRLSKGERVEIENCGIEIVIRPAAPRFTLEELFQGKNATEWRAEYADAFDWGPDVGREGLEDQ